MYLTTKPNILFCSFDKLQILKEKARLWHKIVLIYPKMLRYQVSKVLMSFPFLANVHRRQSLKFTFIDIPILQTFPFR